MLEMRVGQRLGCWGGVKQAIETKTHPVEMGHPLANCLCDGCSHHLGFIIHMQVQYVEELLDGHDVAVLTLQLPQQLII